MKKLRPEDFAIPRSDEPAGHWRQRLRSDFRLAIISLFGLCTMVGILPLAVYRFLVGDWQTGAGDLALVSFIAALVAYAWASGRTRLVARLLALTVTLGYLGLVIFGDISVMWAFPILSAGFMLADRVFASLSALGTLALTSLMAGRFDTLVDTWSFLITGLLVSIFGLIFATRTQLQQRRLAEIANRDPLTQAGNRRALRHALDQAEHMQARLGTPASLILMDLDHFKSVNDVYGHETGDEILVKLVEIVSSRLRRQDGVFRLGGEEFVVVLPDTPAPGAERLAGTLKRSLASQLEGPGGPVTASMGVAELGPSEPVRQWLARADEALYQAKRAGRDCIVMAPGPDD